MTAVQLPDPLVPADVDLRDFGFMPLDVVRLRDSDLATEASGDEFKAAVLLWCASWHQQPPGSLPNREPWLAKHSGAGAVLTWRKVRDMALRGFIECSDGRLYHAVISEKANEAWQAKQAQRARTAAATAAREAKRRAETEARDGSRDGKGDDTRHVPRDDQRNVVQGIGTVKGQGQGQGDLIPPDGGSGSARNAAPPSPPDAFTGENAEALNGKAVVTLAAGFELPDQWGFDAEALGFKPPEVLREAEKFRQFFVSGKGAGTRRSVKGWRQSWSNWLDKAAKDKR